jgi:UDP-2,4-diacetamido-2,4,6-trideoxy-beta-L-altropyranose hydrolase
MRFAFRCDASLQIGSGHVMRCLTLARALHEADHTCHFICRDLPGHMARQIKDAGFTVSLLPAPDADFVPEADSPPHANWAGVDWRLDASQTQGTQKVHAEWLVLDHYAFDAKWQAAAVPPGTRLFVIDDLADRPHVANVLLDQNLGRNIADYDGLIPRECLRLIGPDFALLRSEFSLWREKSAKPAGHVFALRNLLITMGGMDTQNCTPPLLRALGKLSLPDLRQVTVVMGAAAPGLDQTRQALLALQNTTVRLLVETKNMAELMSEADLAIGGAGGTALERCCLGLPTLIVVMAENQRRAAELMQDFGVAIALADVAGIDHAVDSTFDLADSFEKLTPDRLEDMTQACLTVTDGKGTARVVAALLREKKDSQDDRPTSPRNHR